MNPDVEGHISVMAGWRRQPNSDWRQYLEIALARSTPLNCSGTASVDSGAAMPTSCMRS